MKDTGDFFLMIDASDLYNTPEYKLFYNRMINYPGDMITIMDYAA